MPLQTLRLGFSPMDENTRSSRSMCSSVSSKCLSKAKRRSGDEDALAILGKALKIWSSALCRSFNSCTYSSFKESSFMVRIHPFPLIFHRPHERRAYGRVLSIFEPHVQPVPLAQPVQQYTLPSRQSPLLLETIPQAAQVLPVTLESCALQVLVTAQ